MAQPRTMILCATAPSTQEVGGIWLCDWLQELLPVRTSLYTLNGIGAYEAEAVPDGLSVCVADGQRLRVPSANTTKFSRLQTSAQTVLDRFARWPRSLREAIAFGRAQRIEQIWAVLDWPEVYYLAPRLARALDVPLIVTVWDPPESVLLSLRLDRFSRKAALKDFDDALEAAIGGATMSPAMQAAYTERYDLPSVILRHTIQSELIQTPTRRPLGRGVAGEHEGAHPGASDEELVIGFSGSLYARQEWRALVAGLQQRDWRLADRPVRLRMLSGRLDEPVTGPVRIEWLGWRSAGDAVRCLAECDLLYLPYWFAEERRTAVDFCFPSKLTTYMAAGRPIFYHGPESGSPMQFAQRYPVLTGCHTLDPGDIAEQLEHVLSDAEGLERMRSAIPQALEGEFTRTVQRERLAWLLNLQPMSDKLSAPPETAGARG